MKKILIYLLLACNLFSSMVFALDKHPEAMAEQYLSTINTPLDNQHQDHSIHCSHCCQVSTHLLAIFFHHQYQLAVTLHSSFSSHNIPLAYYYSSPLLRPPII